MLAASVLDPEGLKALRNATKPKAQIVLDPRRLQLPPAAAKRKLTNLAVLLVGANGTAA